MKKVGNHIRSQENYFRRSLSLFFFPSLLKKLPLLLLLIRPQLLNFWWNAAKGRELFSTSIAACHS
jgi:hypothetical protein